MAKYCVWLYLSAYSGNSLGIGANNGTTDIFINTSHNVGIGTSSPSRKLSVYGDMDASSIYVSNWFRSIGNNGWFSQTYGGGIYMTDSTYVRVYNNKKFYANEGYLSPYRGGSWLSMATRSAIIEGDEQQSTQSAHALFRVKDCYGNAIAFGGLGGTTGFYGFTASRISSEENGADWQTTWNVDNGALTHTSSLYVGGATTLNAGLSVTGNIVATGEVTAYGSSDIRLKTNIQHLRALDTVRKMNIVEYDWNKEALALRNSSIVHGYGLIAQELEELIPEVVTHDMYGKGFMGIDYRNLVPFALSAIQQVDDEVTSLKKRVEELENRLSKYERV